MSSTTPVSLDLEPGCELVLLSTPVRATKPPGHRGNASRGEQPFLAADHIASRPGYTEHL